MLLPLQELYKNLMFLRNFDGNVEDLCLTFSASTGESRILVCCTVAVLHHPCTLLLDVFGETREVELIPGGSDIPVTSRNRLKYIYLMAALHLDASIKRQCKAFCRGLNELIPNTQLVMFSEPELQVCRFRLIFCAFITFLMPPCVHPRFSSLDPLRVYRLQTSRTILRTCLHC